MSTSRRKFLGTGLLAAIFAAVPLKNALSQSWKDRDGNPANNPPTQADPLANYSKATFKSYLNSIFQLQTFAGIVPVTLLEVGDLPSAKGGECFSLLFRGGSRTFGQETYTLVHPSLGTFRLLLVPTGTDENGAQGYLATINRLSFSDAVNSAAPTKRSGSLQPTSTPTPAPSATPTAPAVPTVTPVQPSVTPPNSPKRKPARRKKPSWKDLDAEIEGELN